MKKDKKILFTGIITAIGASLCCITPVLAVVSGASGLASTFAWLDPFRPYLIAITVVILAFAWYLKLKPQKEIDCDCEEDEKKPFMQSKTFLGLVTVFAAVMLAFPYYGSVFYPDTKKEVLIVEAKNVQTLAVEIEGMTCSSCEEHVNYAVNQLEGIINIQTSYDAGNSIIKFDQTKTTAENIQSAINSTGYTVIKSKQQ